VPFPFTDLTASKLRPALVLHAGGDDVVLAFISSRIPVGKVPTASVVLDRSHPDFDMSGLKTSSVIRLDKVATVLSSLIVGELGVAGSQVCETVNRVVSEVYRL
jgi:mRNA interferase MazF